MNTGVSLNGIMIALTERGECGPWRSKDGHEEKEERHLRVSA
jgi:hypothetical protein